MCLDKMGMVWFQALMMKTEPKLTTPKLSYMLQESNDAPATLTRSLPNRLPGRHG